MIDFIYYRGHVCRVWHRYPDGTIRIEVTTEERPSYMLLAFPGEYQNIYR